STVLGSDDSGLVLCRSDGFSNSGNDSGVVRDVMDHHLGQDIFWRMGRLRSRKDTLQCRMYRFSTLTTLAPLAHLSKVPTSTSFRVRPTKMGLSGMSTIDIQYDIIFCCLRHQHSQK